MYDKFPGILIDKRHALHLFFYLINRIIFFSEINEIKVSISCSQVHKNLIFIITNNTTFSGKNKLDEYLDSNIASSKNINSKGIDIAICRKILELYQSELKMYSVRKEEIIFKFIFPNNGEHIID